MASYKYPRILLTGVTGQVGFELAKSLKDLGEIWSPSRDEFNLQRPDTLSEAVRDYLPDLIVNPAAFTAVDRAETEPDLAETINAQAPMVLAREANRLGIPLVHFSTDYVFDGEKTDPYSEDDGVNPINIYGKTKLSGEKLIGEFHDKYLIFRTCWVYSRTRGANFYLTIKRLLESKEVIKVVQDEIGTPTSAHFLARKVAAICGQLNVGQFNEARWSTYHLTGSKVQSRFEFATAIFEELSHQSELKTKRILPISSNEFKSAARRPLNSVLSNERVYTAFDL